MAAKESTTHLGTKTLGLVFGLTLGFLWVLFNMFFVWLPVIGTTGVTLVMIGGTLGIFVVVVFAVPAIIFLAQIFWKWMHKLSETIGD